MSAADNNYRRVAEDVWNTALKYGRNPEDISVIAVSKTQPAGKMLEAAGDGARLFGESRVQEAVPKIIEVKEAYPNAEFHFIGRVQTNKAKKLVEYFSLIHSVDRPEAALALNGAAKAAGKRLDVLLQLNLAGETQKNGISIDKLDELADTAVKLPNLNMRGFMLIPPFENNSENNRIYFRKADEIYEKYKKNKNFNVDVLSMGMSGDYRIAVSEGATMVRIGTAIFGAR